MSKALFWNMNVASVKISIPDSVGLNTIFKVLVPDNF